MQSVIVQKRNCEEDIRLMKFAEGICLLKDFAGGGRCVSEMRCRRDGIKDDWNSSMNSFIHP